MSVVRARLGKVAVAAVLTASVVLLGGCSAITDLLGGGATRDDDTQEITEAGTADVFDITVGDCFDDVSDGVVYEVPAVPCGEEHDNEVYYEFEVEEGPFPGEEFIDQLAGETCKREFEAFVGLDWDNSELQVYPFTPTEGGWKDLGDRVIQCVIYDPSGPVTGSLEGAAR